MANLRNYTRLKKHSNKEFEFKYQNGISIYVYVQLKKAPLRVDLLSIEMVTPNKTYKCNDTESNPVKLRLGTKHLEFFKNEIINKEESWVNNELNSLFQMLGNVQEESKQIEDVLQADYRKEELNYLYENQGNVELAIQNYELK